MTWGQILNDLSTWLSTGALVGIFTLLSRHWLASRRATIEEHQDERKGLGELVAALTLDIATVRDHHAQCQAQLSQLQGAVHGLQQQVLAIVLKTNNKGELSSETRELLGELIHAMTGAAA
jgi:hypothetical protein